MDNKCFSRASLRGKRSVRSQRSNGSGFNQFVDKSRAQENGSKDLLQPVALGLLVWFPGVYILERVITFNCFAFFEQNMVKEWIMG